MANQSRKPNRFWDNKENIIHEAKLFIKEFGPEKFKPSELRKNGYGSLLKAISTNGGVARMREELGISGGNRPQGYWQEEANLLEECRAYIASHGINEFNSKKVIANERPDLAAAVRNEGGGWVAIREKLGLKRKVVKIGYWKDESNILKESKEFIDKHGEENFKTGKMTQMGYSALVNAISNTGGIKRIREKLGLQQTALINTTGYWKIQENILHESKAYIDKYGPNAFTSQKLYANGFSSISNAFIYHGGINNVRKLLGIEKPINETRRVNLEELKRTLRNLKIEGVAGLTSSQMIILLQQGGFDKLPLNHGGDVFKAVASGALTPQGLIDWGISNQQSPSIDAEQEQVDGSPKPLNTSSGSGDVETELFNPDNTQFR